LNVPGQKEIVSQQRQLQNVTPKEEGKRPQKNKQKMNKKSLNQRTNSKTQFFWFKHCFFSVSK